MRSKLDKSDKSFTANSDSENDNYKRGEHPNSRANLTPYKTGQSGNILGKPNKYENLKKILKELGNKYPDYFGETEGTRKEQVWYRIWIEAIRGDIRYIQLLADWGCLDE